MSWIRSTLPFCHLLLLVDPAVAQERSDTVVIRAGEPRYPGVASVTTELMIGVAEGEDAYLFDRIESILVADDGTIWILERPAGSPQLRQYDAEGRYLRTVAQRGGGPGELTRPTGMAQLRDGRVIVRDLTANRINVYTADGRPDTTWTFTTPYAWPGGGRDGLRVDAAGFVWMPFSIVDREALESGPPQFVRMRADGSILDTIPTPELPDVRYGTITVTTPTGSRYVMAAPYPSRAGWWWSRGGYFVTGITSRYALDLRVPPQRAASAATPATWSPRDPVVSIRRDVAPVTVSDAERRDQQAYLDWQVNRREGTRSGPIPEVPRTKPAYKTLAVAEDGRLWVNVFVPSERFEPEPIETPPGEPAPPVVGWREPMVFDVLETNGTCIGRVALPGNTYPQWIRGDVIWAVYRDENGVEVARKLHVDWGG